MNPLKTPVAFLVFNRPETTRRVFKAIRDAQPDRLLVIADGPRRDRPGEIEKCKLVRKIVQDVAWPCQLQTNFSAVNMGCRQRVISGLDWVFSIVEEAIILEDDCVPDPSFFPYCSEMLARFRHDSRIGMISGTNFVEKFCTSPYSYFFSHMFHIWGWATWRTSWARYDPNLKNWPAIKTDGVLSEVFDDRYAVEYLSKIFDQMYEGVGPNTWDYQWLYTNLFENALSVVPRKNLITNIGFGPGATHTLDSDSHQSLPSGTLDFPLKHPPAIVPLRWMDRIDLKVSLLPTWRHRFSHNVRRTAKYLMRSLQTS